MYPLVVWHHGCMLEEVFIMPYSVALHQYIVSCKYSVVHKVNNYLHN